MLDLTNKIENHFPEQFSESWRQTSLRPLKKYLLELGELSELDLKNSIQNPFSDLEKIAFVEQKNKSIKYDDFYDDFYSSRFFRDIHSDKGCFSLKPDFFKNADLSKPLLLFFTPESHLTQKCIELLIPENCKVQIVDLGMGLGSKSMLNFNFNITLSPNSQLDWICIDDPSHFAGFSYDFKTFNLAEDSKLNYFSLAGAHEWQRSDMLIRLVGSNAECNINSAYIGSNNSLIDHHTFVHHLAPQTKCYQEYRGILADESRAVFNGRIKINEGMSGTSSKQYSHNMLVSDKAKVHTKPELQIDHDDVECAHGATLGAIDQGQLFYLMSRGINYTQARAMLCQSYISKLWNNSESVELKQLLNELTKLYLSNNPIYQN